MSLGMTILYGWSSGCHQKRHLPELPLELFKSYFHVKRLLLEGFLMDFDLKRLLFELF